jgi:YVTN family beta-propeller protein
MEFRILGPLEVVDGEGRPVPVHRGKEQALLAYLLLHPNEVLPSDRLIDELWGERAPPTAPKIVQNAVSHLRKALGEGRLMTQPPGYLFRLEPGELDLQRFERLAEEGRAAGDAKQLREALALWRGEPLAELRDEPFARRAALHLEDTRLGVLEDRIDADIRAGRHSELVAELEELIAAHPLRERLHGQLMLALYRAGRQADALEAYQRARKTLSQELGLEPSPQLQELERKILMQDPELAAPARAERQLGRLPLLPARPTIRIAFVSAAVLLVVAAAVSLGLIFALDEDSAPLIAKRNSLVAIDPSRNRIVHVTEVGADPRGVAVGGSNVWVANSADGTVSRVDGKTLRVVQTIGIGAQATELVTAAGALWVATGIDNTLVKIDARTGGLLATVSLPPAIDAAAWAVAAGHGAIWVASGNRIFKIGPRSNAILLGAPRTLGCCGSVRDVAFGLGAAWMTTIHVVVRISESRGVPTVMNLGVVPTALTVGFGAVWVGSSGPSSPDLVIWRLDPQTLRVTRTISIGRTNSFLGTVDVAAGAGAVWATNSNDGTLVRIDPRTGKVDATIRIGRHPRGIAVGADRIWVTVD